MNHYQKTALGLDALQQRHIPLNARQRRLLVLIGTEDFEQWLISLNNALQRLKSSNN